MKIDKTQLDESFSALDKKFQFFKKKKGEKPTKKPADDKTAKADGPMEDEDPLSDLRDDLIEVMYQMCGSLRSQIYATQDMHYSYCNEVAGKFDNHKTGHLPPLTPSAMGKVLKSCGMDGDYNVAKPTLTCSASEKDGIFEVTISETK